MRRRAIVIAVVLGAAMWPRVAVSSPVDDLPGLATPAVPATTAEEPDGEWLAGDLHVHSTYSHDSYGGPGDDDTHHDEAYTAGLTVEQQFTAAAARGLDYLAVTDHNDVRSQQDPGFGAAGVIPLPGYEQSLQGHAQMLGATRLYDAGDQSAAAVQAAADALRADGGVFQINHPAEGSTDPHDLDWGYGTEIVPDTVEVWNISRLWQPPLPSASSNDDAVRFWESFLDAGHRVAATGGSDSHWASTAAVQGVGQPTTWVFAEDRTPQAVLEGIRSGHTFISHQPPALGGPRLVVEADGDGDGTFEALMGDVVPRGSAIRVRAEGAPGARLRLVGDGGNDLTAPVMVAGPRFEHEFLPDETTTWIRAEIAMPDADAEREAACDPAFGADTTYCRNQLLVLAMTSALYLRDQVVQEPTVLTWTGDDRLRGQSVTFAARLTEADGPALVGRDVVFEADGRTWSARTDDDGVASVTVELSPLRSEVTVTSRFDGDPSHDPSTTTTVLRRRPAP